MRPRVIPCLLVSGGRLVKTRRFRDPTYIGDPLNAVRIFNEKGADELAVLDIEASRAGREPDLDLVTRLSGECFMPLAYGGGIARAEHAERLVRLGVEKVIVNTAVVRRPALIGELARAIGSQSVVVSIDVEQGPPGRYSVRARGGKEAAPFDPVGFARKAEELGAGELIVNAIHRDGMMQGYDITLIRTIAMSVGVPVIALGGAGTVSDLVRAVREGRASAVAAGSMFVFKGPHRAVLISLPRDEELDALLPA